MVEIGSLLPSVAVRVRLTSSDVGLHGQTNCPDAIYRLVLRISYYYVVRVVVSPAIAFKARRSFFSIVRREGVARLVVRVQLIFFVGRRARFSNLCVRFTGVQLIPYAIVTLRMRTFSIF